MRPLDLKYGMWTVVEDRGQRVLCRCDCGTEADVLRTDLNRHDQKKRSTSCGCRRRAYDRATTTIQPGDRFGRLTAVARVSSGRDKRWRFVCDCGKETVPVLSYVIKGASRSCGCRLREARTHGHTAGGRKTPEYEIWAGMIQRCTNPNSEAFPYYGGRGIAVCERWRSYEHFIADMGPRPSPKHSLERQDNDGGYEPGNVVWTTRKKQMRNTRRNYFVVFHGKRMSLTEACEIAGMNYGAAHKRLGRGWPIDDALTIPLDSAQRRYHR